jgi:hypothetical protein
MMKCDEKSIMEHARRARRVLSAVSVANSMPHPFVAYLSESDGLAVDSFLVADTEFVTALTVYMIHRFDEES